MLGPSSDLPLRLLSNDVSIPETNSFQVPSLIFSCHAMSLPRPGGHFGEKKASSIYSGGPSSTSNAFAAYNAPSATPQHHYNPVASNTPGQAGFSYSGASGSGGGGDGFGTAGAGVPQGFARETPPVGGTPAGGALGRGAGDQWDQYGFSNVGIGGGSGRGSGGMDAFSGSVGSAPGGAMGIGGRAGANQQGAGAGVGGQPPLDWHQWAPPGVNKQVTRCVGCRPSTPIFVYSSLQL